MIDAPERTPSGQAAAMRVLLLPGAFGNGADFAAAGFNDEVRTRDLPLELVFADLEFRHVTDRSILERLRDGPLAAARRAGCRSVWLAGVSLGAYIALVFAERFPGEVDGLCLLAPYLGTRLVSGAIARAGGLARWANVTGASDDEEERVWRFAAAPTLPVYVGYGRSDRFADAQRLLANVLPPSRVDAIDGAHDWPTWRTLWGRFLDRWPLPGEPSAVRIAG